MCGRYTLSTVDGPALAQRFSLDSVPVPETLGRFNVCPTEAVAVVTGAEPQVGTREWGLRPRGADGPLLINARSETVATKGLFAKLMRRDRCLVPADGWYEWLKAERKGEPRIPFRYTVDGGAPFAFAGLCNRHAVTVLTCAANAVCAPVHDRMPVVLADPDAEAAWLAGEDVDVAAALELLGPLDAARVSVAPANPAVNKAGVEGPELLVAPAGVPAAGPPADDVRRSGGSGSAQTSLFGA
jgi:putative SOS response-associated peptidase YedK